jgi:hypothetical protein
MKENDYEKAKIDPEAAKTDFEKSFVKGWNNLMDSIQKGGSRIAVVEYNEEDLKERDS